MNQLNSSHILVDWLVHFVGGVIEPAMMMVFACGILLRLLIQYTVKREDWFAKEFEKRISRFMDGDKGASQSFHTLTKRLLEQTFYELFEIRGIMRRRKMDYIMAPSDRVFLIHSGCARIVRDTLKQIRFLRYKEEHPKFLEISKSVFQNNPCFSKVFGIIPAGGGNDFLNALPGLFVVGGIFGTFLGIMRALPELGGMNLNDVEGTKLVMDGFLLKVSFSMSSSVTGIFLSVCTQLFNIALSPDKIFIEVVNRYELALEYLWRRCDNNMLQDNNQFDENRDPVEAMAELAVSRQLSRTEGSRDGNRPRTLVAASEAEEAAKKNPPADLPDDRRQAS